MDYRTLIFQKNYRKLTRERAPGKDLPLDQVGIKHTRLPMMYQQVLCRRRPPAPPSDRTGHSRRGAVLPPLAGRAAGR